MSNEELIVILEERFIKNQSMHMGIMWNDILNRLTDQVLIKLKYMEEIKEQLSGTSKQYKYNSSIFENIKILMKTNKGI